MKIGKAVYKTISRNVIKLGDRITDTTWDSVNNTLRLVVTNNISGEVGNLIWGLVSRRVNKEQYAIRRINQSKSN